MFPSIVKKSIKKLKEINAFIDSKFPLLLILKRKFMFISILIALLFILSYYTKASLPDIEKIQKKSNKNTDLHTNENQVTKIVIIPQDDELSGLERNKSRSVADYIPDSADTFSILPKSVCNSDKFLVNFVTSAPQYFQKRQAIRDTWAENFSRSDVATYFVMGLTSDLKVQQKLVNESEKYDDIIQENFLDTYNNLTLKSITILKVVDKFCANRAKYIFKVDDDVYVNLSLFLSFLSSNQKEEFLAGRIYKYVGPVRNPKYKWYCPRYLFNGKFYPTYLAGAGYVMSSNVARTLYKTTFNTPLLHIEDVYVTGMCAKKANISHTGDLRFTSLPGYRKCQIRQLFTMHYQSPSDMQELHELLKSNATSETICPQPK